MPIIARDAGGRNAQPRERIALDKSSLLYKARLALKEVDVRAWVTSIAAAFFIMAGAVHAQGRSDPTGLISAEAEAMKPFAWMQGRWQGEAWVGGPSAKHRLVHTERAGPMLGGTLMVIEGRSFETDGRPANFDAFAVIAYDPTSKTYTFRSFAQGRAGDFPMEATPDGYAWKIAAGPMTLRYTAHHAGDHWSETGEMVRPDGAKTLIFEMELHRVGESDWPLAGQATGGWTP